jgi:serine/threonine protein kinase
MATALEQFVKQLEDSGVIAPGKLQNFVPPQANPTTPQELAQQLVAGKHLTKYQAREIYQGRAKSLILGNYTITDRIGAGGMGQVFKAEHRRMHRVVALKVLPTAAVKSAPAVARFGREVEAAAKLEHPNIVAAYDADEAAGVHFLVMQFIDGVDLSALVKKSGPLPVGKAVNYVLQAARGLAYAHAQHVVHRDIKPANLLLDRSGTVKILDMGLARIESDQEAATRAELTGSGAVLGTVDYMAPEQSLSTKSADGRADIYSLGCTLCFLLTGKPAYQGDSIAAKLLAHHQQPIPDLTEIRPDVSPELQAVFSRMVAKQIADRYQSMDEVVGALGEIGQQAETAQSFGATSTEMELDSGVLTFLKEGPASKSKSSATAKKSAAQHALSVERSRWKSKTAIGAAVVGAVILAGIVFRFRSSDSTPAVQVVKSADAAAPAKPSPVAAATVQSQPADEHPPLRKSNALKPWQRAEFVKWTDEVAAMPAEKQVAAVVKKLEDLNPHYQGVHGGFLPRDAVKIDGGEVTEFGIWTEVVTDISPIRALRGLKSLRVNGRRLRWGKLADLSPLAGMNLIHLNCDNTEVADLSPLAGMPLKQIECGGTLVSDLSRLNGMSLRILHCSGTRVHDLSPLRGMPIFRLDCSSTGIADLSPVEGMRLVRLNIALTQIRDLSPVRGMPIKWMAAGNTPISDLSPLAGMPLEYLECPATKVYDLSPLHGMPLAGLYISETAVGDLSPLAGAPLEVLRCGHTTVSDLSPITKAPLKILHCDNTRIADLFPLRRMPLKELYCDHTRVSDLSPLGGIKTLQELRFSPKNITGGMAVIRGLTNLKTIGTTWGDGIPTFSPGEFWKKYDAGDFSTWRDTELRRIRALKPEQQLEAIAKKLQDLNPGFDGKLTGFASAAPKIEDGRVVELGIATQLVSDASPLQALRDLTAVSCNGGWPNNSRFSDLSQLRGLQLVRLHCIAAHVTDLSPLRGMPLVDLNCSGAPVVDLSPLEGMKLVNLSCANTLVTDLSPMAGMPLRVLKCGSTKIADLSPLRGIGLTVLHCDTTRVADLSPLAGMPLVVLLIHDTAVVDLSPLTGMHLQEIRFTPKNIKRGIEALRDMKSLQRVALHDWESPMPVAEFWTEYDAGEFK